MVPVLARVEAPGAVASLGDEVGLLQHAEVLGDRRSGDVAELVGDVGGRELLGPHEPEDRPPPWLGERLEGRVHPEKINC